MKYRKGETDYAGQLIDAIDTLLDGHYERMTLNDREHFLKLLEDYIRDRRYDNKVEENRIKNSDPWG